MAYRTWDVNQPTFQPEAFEKFKNELLEELAPEGYSFHISDEEREGGFRRVYFNRRGGPVEESDLYLDLRIGPRAAKGYVVEAATSKPGTFGMPGFSRHVEGEKELRSTVNTFADYIRTIYHLAGKQDKTPQEMVWTAYQKGSKEYQLPGFGRFVTPGAGSGMRTFTAQVVPYYLRESEYPQDYFRKMEKQAVSGLERYGPRIGEWNAWTPLGTGSWKQANLLGVDKEQIFAPMSEEKMKKGSTLWAEAREIAGKPMVYNPKTKRYDLIEPSGTNLEELRGSGIRTGWTRASGILPGETEPANMYVQRVVLGDQPDLPGSAYVSPDAFKFTRDNEEIEVYAFGTEANAMYRFGIASYDELEKLVEENKLRFDNIEGIIASSGPSKFRFASIMEPDKKNPKKLKERPLRIDRKGYDLRLSKGTLYIPKYIDRETGLFSNFPRLYNDAPSTTNELVENLRKRFGDTVNVEQISAIGGSGDKPAEVYFNAPVQRKMGLSAKTAGFKAGLSELLSNMYMQFRGMGDFKHKVDMYTQEGKIPSRILMTSFYAMNMRTQMAFLDEFLGGDPDAVSAVKSYVMGQYEVGLPHIDPDEMAELYGKAAHKGPMSGDMLFNQMFRNILMVDNDKKAKRMFEEFGVGLPVSDFLSAQVYSGEQAGILKDLINRAAQDVPEIKDMITFERIKREPLSDLVQAMTDEPFTADDAYRVSFQLPDRGTVALMAGTRMVEEFPSQSGFVNTKSIMSLMQYFPEMSYRLGLTDETGDPDWAGPLEARTGDVRRSAKGWFEMASWMSFQKELNQGKMLIPSSAVEITPRLKEALLDAVTHAKREKLPMRRLETLKEELRGLDSQFLIGRENWDLSNVMFYDRETGTLIPNIRAIEGIEKEKEGVEIGNSSTFFGENYMNLLEQTVLGGSHDPSFDTKNFARVRRKMFTRIASAFHPEGGRSKDVFRNIMGANLPGSRGGRYQGHSALEIGEAFADDDYIISALAQGGFKDREQIASILNYLKSSPDAYLPIMFQRYPDVSSEYQFAPFRLRSGDYYKALGKQMPSGPASRDILFMSQLDANRVMVGDWDDDAYGMTILPIEYDEETKRWGMEPALQKEFDQASIWYKDPSNVPAGLEAMFGSKAKGLDVALKNLIDYSKAVVTGETSLLKRLAVKGTYSARALYEGQVESVGFSGGKAQSYNRRTLTEDIAAAVLGMGNDRIRNMAYEAGAMPYQGYLDYMPELKGGLTQLETMINTFGIYGSEDDLAKGKYYFWYKLTGQGTPEGEGEGGVYAPSAAMGRLLPSMMQKLAREADWKQSAAALAWGFASRGRGEEVFQALSDPGAYMERFGYDPSRATRGSAMLMLHERGAIGYDSPYYTSMAFRAVKRLATKHPEAASNRNIRLPWLGNNIMSVPDIMETDEYKMFDVAERLTMKGGEPIGAEEMEYLRKFKGDRLGSIFRGIHKTWRKVTGGIIETDPVLEELSERLEAAAALFEEDPDKKAKMSAEDVAEAEKFLEGVEERKLEAKTSPREKENFATYLKMVKGFRPDFAEIENKAMRESLENLRYFPDTELTIDPGWTEEEAKRRSRIFERLRKRTWPDLFGDVYPTDDITDPTVAKKPWSIRARTRGSSRMAGGGGEYGEKRIRVGEGGPEEIIVGENSEITVVPTHEMTESRRARGEDVSREGYLGERLAGGKKDEPGGWDQPEGSKRSLDDVFDRLDKLIDVLMKRNDPNTPNEQIMDIPTGAKVRSIIGDIGLYGNEMASFTEKAEAIMQGAYERSGLGKEFSRLVNPEEGGTRFGLSAMISGAALRGISPEEYMPEMRRQGLIPQARELQKVLRGARSYIQLEKKHGKELFNTLLSPEQADILASQVSAITMGQGDLGLEEALAGAEQVAGFGQARAGKKPRHLGALVEAYKEDIDAQKALTDATLKLEEARSKGVDTEEAYNKLVETRLEQDIRRTERDIRGRKAEVAEFYPEGKFVGWKEAQRMVDTGEAPRTWLDEAWDIEGREGVLAKQQQSLERRTAPGAGISRRLGMISRRLLGGFGLMYLQSIGGIIAGPTQRGYAGGMEQELLAEQAFAARAPGVIPGMPLEARIARADAMYGGVGWRSMRGAYANILENQPGLVGLGGMGQAGVAGFGLAAFMTNMIAPTAAVLPPALAAGGIAALATYGMQVGGAYTQPETTAIELASRTLAGKRQPFLPMFDKAYMARLFEEGSERAGSREGIIQQQALIEQIGKMLQTGEGGFMEVGPNYGGTGQVPLTTSLTNIQSAMSRLGVTGRADQTRLMADVARAMAPQYEVGAPYLYQAMALGMEYGMPLQFGKGGTFELLGAQLEQGIPIEELARQQAMLPWLTGREREERTANVMQAWLDRGGLTTTEIARVQERQGIQEALGVMMPNIKPETVSYWQRERRQIEGTGVFRPGEDISYTQMALGSLGSGIGGGFTEAARRRGTYIPPEFEDVMVERTRQVNMTEQWLERVREQPMGVQEAYLQRMAIEQSRRARGAEFTGAEEAFEEYEGMGEQEAIAAQRRDRATALFEEAINSLTDSFIKLGDALPDPAQFEGLQTMAEVNVAQQYAQVGLGLAQQMIIGGAAPQGAEMLGAAFARMGVQDPGAARMYQGMMQGDRMRWAQWAMQQTPQTLARLPETVAGLGGSRIQMDDFFLVGYDERRGGLTGLPYGTTSLATPIATSQQMATNIFGARETWSTAGYVPPGETTGPGYDAGLIDALINGGMREAQQYQNYLQYNQQMAMYGIQQQQINLQRQYQPLFWNVQDQYRQLGYAQTEWGLQMQEQQLGLSRQYFQQTTGLQRQQMGMQRAWTQEDWAYEDQVRGLKWQWRQEDFAESVRFMTGRERRLAERQMGRETIMHGLEEDQIEKKRSRQEELWALEDDRFAIQIAHQEAMFALQEENIAKQREFFEERKRLDEEQTQLQRQYWEENMQIQQEALNINVAYAEQMYKIQQTMTTLNEHIEDANGRLSLFSEETLVSFAAVLGEIDPLFKSFLGNVEEFQKLLEDAAETEDPESIGLNPGGGGMQYGGRVYPGSEYIVGEAGPELFKPDLSGTIVPIGDPWGTEIISSANGGGGGDTHVHVTVSIGNEQLEEFMYRFMSQELSS